MICSRDFKLNYDDLRFLRTTASALYGPDFFKTYNTASVTGKAPNLKAIYKAANTRVLCNIIFITFLKNLISELIEKGDFSFKLPSNSYSTISIEKIDQNMFKENYLKGYYQDIDFIETDFTSYTMVFKNVRKNRTIRRRVGLSRKYKARFVSKINSGFKYC